MIKANYYDGHSAREQAVTIQVAHGLLQVRGEGLVLDVPLTELRISEKLGSAPRLLYFAGAGHCEVSDHAELESVLKAAGLTPQSLLSRIENSWRHALAATVVAIAIVSASFYWGLPWAADIAAARIPDSVTQTMDTHFLDVLDGRLLQITKLGKTRQNALRKRFLHLRDAHGTPAQRLEFRNSPDIGANAFALPGGTVVVTDQLVALAGNDEEILAVLAHELGHVSERHPMRQLLQSSVVGLAMTWYLGDISTLLAAAPALLLESSYSRNFERSADRYAADMLRINGMAPTRLADMLEKLEQSHRGTTKINTQYSYFARLFSTHPDTGERIRDLRSEAAN